MCSREESQAEINLILVSNYFKPKKKAWTVLCWTVLDIWLITPTFSPCCFQGRWEIRLRIEPCSKAYLKKTCVVIVHPISRRELTGFIVVVTCLCCILSVPQLSCLFFQLSFMEFFLPASFALTSAHLSSCYSIHQDIFSPCLRTGIAAAAPQSPDLKSEALFCVISPFPHPQNLSA